jgi:FKBP-type peptidyl-prolyl cis-trans isomerase FkpA
MDVKCKGVFSITFLFIFGFIVSCSESSSSKESVVWTKEKSIELNRVITLEEKIDIKLFLERHKIWKMVETGSGLQYYIYENGEGERAVPGMTVDIMYKVMTLDEKVCYETGEDEVLEVKIDHSEIETGLQEGLKKMRVGDKAKMIIPSHLAHGLSGDYNKIPPLTPIVVDVQLVEIL